MPLEALLRSDAVGEEMHAFATELYPLCRSITGNGVRETLSRIAERIPLEIHEVPSGTKAFDWTVPREWNIRDAYVKNAKGERILDFHASNLHVVSYSAPVHATVSLAELREHVISLPDQPSVVPYRTSYYHEEWGLCMRHDRLSALEEGDYEVLIDSELRDGSLTYGECVLAGDSSDEVLLSAHVCHPSLANDNLSGIALLTALGRRLQQVDHRYSYRLLFAPGTIGSIAWLARNEARVERIRHGLVLSCVGDAGGPTYKRSQRGDAPIDRAVQHVLAQSPGEPVIEDFSPYGYDERQFCSPGFDLPVGLFQRSKHGTFPEYHTSADDLDFVAPENLASSFRILVEVLQVLEEDRRFVNLNPRCEPQLGRRGLYDAIGGDKDHAAKQMALLWVLNQSDGSRSLLDIAERAQLPFARIAQAARLLLDAELLRLADA
jgi:aminopeptidase-like protein